MAKARKDAIPAPPPPVSRFSPPPPPDNEDEIAGALQAINNAAGQDGEIEWQVKVYQVLASPRDGMTEPFLFNSSIPELESLDERLIEDFPEGGKFRVRVRANKRPFKQFDIQLAKRRTQTIAPAAASSDMTRAFEVLDGMMQRQERFFETVVARLSSAAPAPVATTNGIDHITQTLALVKAINDANPRPEPNIGLGLFEKGFDIALKIADTRDSGGGSGIMGMLKEIITPDTVKMFMQMNQPAAAAAPQIGNGPQPAPNASPLASVPEQFSYIVRHLVDQARGGTDPALAANWVLENVPPSVLDMLNGPDGLSTPEQIVDYLAGAVPEVNQYRNWFIGLVTSLLSAEDDESLGTEDGEAEIDGPAPDSRRNPGNP